MKGRKPKPDLNLLKTLVKQMGNTIELLELNVNPLLHWHQMGQAL